ncbi:MAG: 5-deoxy-glucuronate isomerase [Christensenellaceae bacterium]|jgi:5-deoxy-glucuronate isomerase|nr:5-deoxy-glucuronate isomerase [Christensenellaceae bacterium]
MFIYPKFDKNGFKTVTRQDDARTGSMLQDVGVIKIAENKSAEYFSETDECAILLLQGEIVFEYEGKSADASRSNVFKELPTVLHFPRGVRAVVRAITDSEILFQATENEKVFPSKLYRKEDLEVVTSCKDKWEGVASREVVTVFDYRNAPYSNLVMGEVYAPQGHWWSYIPHFHPQPEVYYYKFDRPEGFGACFIGEKASTIKDGSAGLFDGGFTHVQVTAPGYPMYCAWLIRHLPGNPWISTRTDDPRYAWLLD